MFVLIIIMVAACVWIEMRIVNSMPVVGAICEKYKVMSLVFSFLLSMIMGAAFGAAGLIVFASGIISTVCIQPWYRMRANGTIDKFHQWKKDTRDRWNANRDLYIRRARQVARGIQFCVKVVMFPFMLIGRFLDWIDASKQRIADTKARMAKAAKRFTTHGS